MNEPEAIKVVLVGESGVGKTSIISQFTTKKFDPHRETSLSAQFISKTVEFQDLGKAIKFDIWDTVGQEKYRALAEIFYRDAKVIIFVYDITTEYSFAELKNYWYKETTSKSMGKPLYAVVANKIDKYSEQTVSNNEGIAFAEEIGGIFQTTSALSDSGITQLFDNIGKTYLIPGFDYKATDKKAQEEFLKKKQEEDTKNEKKKREKRGVKLEEGANSENALGAKDRIPASQLHILQLHFVVFKVHAVDLHAPPLDGQLQANGNILGGVALFDDLVGRIGAFFGIRTG